MSVLVVRDPMAELSREEIDLLGEALAEWASGLGFEVVRRDLKMGDRADGGNDAVVTVHRRAEQHPERRLGAA